MKVKFVFEYETEHSARFKEVEEPNKFGSLYIRKWFWEKELNKKEEVELEIKTND